MDEFTDMRAKLVRWKWSTTNHDHNKNNYKVLLVDDEPDIIYS